MVGSSRQVSRQPCRLIFVHKRCSVVRKLESEILVKWYTPEFLNSVPNLEDIGKIQSVVDVVDGLYMC